MAPPAFTIPIPLLSRPILCTPLTSRRPPTTRPPAHFLQRRSVRMLGPFFPGLGDTKLIKSEIVRKELEALERDYAELSKIGLRYETFDREGKLMFVESAKDVVDRFAVFLTRLRLSEEFSAQMFVKQYQVRLEEYGLTIESLVSNTLRSLEMMKEEVGK